MVKPFTNNNEIDFRHLITRGRPFAATLNYMLKCAGYTRTRVAKETGVSVSAVTQTISRSKKNKKVAGAICRVLGFDPWVASIFPRYHHKTNKTTK